MYNLLKFGACFGVVASLVGCSASEHFMQDDVYNTRTPIMPPGTDLNDVTDYATFVAKKEQTEIPQERTTYVSPRQYNDYFYYSQYTNYGYSPYAPVTGLSYYGYGNYYHPIYGNGNGFGMYFGNPYHYGYSSAYSGYGYNQPYYGGNIWGGNNLGYSPINKPNTGGGNLSNAHAGTSAGRMGSTNNGIIGYQNKMIAKPNTQSFSGVGRNTLVNSSPVVNSGGGRNANLNTRAAARPANTGRSSVATERTGTYNRTATESNSNSNSGGSNRTLNSNSNTRTSSPTIRSGGSSGGSVSSPSSGGGSRSGGRR